MPGKLKIELSAEKKQELQDCRDHHPRPYMRERAAAILKISEGLSGREVALHRLLRPHWDDTIYEWVKRYQEDGLAGLKIQAGRGRKPAFSPSVPDERNRS